MSERTCLHCGQPSPTEKNWSRGLDKRCYQRLRDQGKIDQYPLLRESDYDIDEQVEKYLKLISSGWDFGTKEACRELEVPYSTMVDRLRRRGLRMNGRPLSEKKISYRANPETLVEDYWTLRDDNADLTMVQIAEKLGVSDRTLYRALKAANNADW